MTYPSELMYDIDTLVHTSQAKRILWLSRSETNPFAEYCQQQAVLGREVEVVSMNPQEIDQILQLDNRFDLAVAADFLEHLQKVQGSQLISRLRDLIATQFCVALPLQDSPSKSDWHLTDLLALAMQRVSHVSKDDINYALFKYSIENYKKTPDWLNADNWANPEMWGKYWW